MMKWRDDRSRTSAGKMIKLLGTVMKPDSRGGVTVGWDNELEHGAVVVERATAMSRKIRERQRVRLVREAIVAAARSKQLNPNGVLSEIERVQRSYLGRKRLPYVLATHISIEYAPILRSVRLKDAHLTFSRRLPRRFREPDVLVRNERQAAVKSAGYCAVRVAVRERDPSSAGDLALDRLDYLRGLWNLSLNHGRTKKWIGGAGQPPQNDIVLGPFQTLHSPDGAPTGDLFWWEPTHLEPIRACRFTPQKYDELRKEEAWYRVRSRGSPAREAFAGLVIRYGRALDERELGSAFLKLWALLEDLVGVDRARYDELVKRVVFISADPTYTKLVFNSMRDWRNRVVHDGDTLHQPDVFVREVRRFVEHLLHFGLRYPRHFRAIEDLGQFLALPRDEKVLKHRMKLHSLAVAFR